MLFIFINIVFLYTCYTYILIFAYVNVIAKFIIFDFQNLFDIKKKFLFICFNHGICKCKLNYLLSTLKKIN